MNELTQNSQGANLPKTKSQTLFSLISNSGLHITSSVVVANLSQLTDIHEAIKDGDLNEDSVHAVLALTESHLYSIDSLMDSAIGIYNFVDFQYCKKIAKDLLLAIQTYKFCTLSFELKGSFLYGFFLSALKLDEHISALDNVVSQDEGRING